MAESGRRTGRMNVPPVPARVTAPSYEHLVALMERVYESPYTDLYGRTADEIREASIYHGRRREYVQTDGKPYNTHDWAHYLNRYGSRNDGPHRAPTYLVGVLKTTVEEMGRKAMMDVEARRTLRILGESGW